MEAANGIYGKGDSCIFPALGKGHMEVVKYLLGIKELDASKACPYGTLCHLAFNIDNLEMFKVQFFFTFLSFSETCDFCVDVITSKRYGLN